MQELAPKWWMFWKWHLHRCQTMHGDSGHWGECITCGKRFGFVSREDMRRYMDAEIAWEMRKRGIKP